MAAKKKLSKEDLRKAMLEAKKKHSAMKKIESPLARYNELDQLTCVLCKSVVRNEALWPVHLNSKTHKENIELAKKMKIKSTAPPVATIIKRPSSFEEPQASKKIKSILKNSGQSQASVKSSLPADFFENSPSVSGTVLPNNNVNNGVNGSNDIVTEEEKIDEAKDIKDNNQLPEGFFDDPIQDAKARNVEYKNPIEEEWERFQKEIKEETAQSEQIIGDDQEEAATERQLDVIEEQLRNWSRVMDLVKQKELVKTTEKKQENTDSSSDEEDIDEFLDWRAKKSYRE